MTHYDWNRMPLEQLNPLLGRRVIHTPGLTIARLEIRKGAEVPEHHHIHEQVANVERGALQFWFGDEQVLVTGGQSVAIPPNVPHRVVALEDSVVVDVFTPCRQDWLQGDDSYLRK